MNSYDTGNLSYSRRFRDAVVIIHVRPWMEAVAAVCGFLMITGLLELLP
jgi:hypothetical protein